MIFAIRAWEIVDDAPRVEFAADGFLKSDFVVSAEDDLSQEADHAGFFQALSLLLFRFKASHDRSRPYVLRREKTPLTGTLCPQFLNATFSWQQHQWAPPVQVLAFTRGRKSDRRGFLPVELGRMSQAVKVTIRPSFGNTCRFCPPNPRHIQTYSVESGTLDNHHLKP
jgi:hypothetical protein